MLNNVSDEFDKSEGSFFWDMLGPVALALQEVDISNTNILAQAFATSATGDNLTNKAAELNVIRKPASYASGLVQFEGTDGAVVPSGTLVSSDTVYFQTTTEYTIGSSADQSIICTEAGSQGNLAAGVIKNMPISIAGVTEVVNTTATTGGVDEETDDELRARYFETVANVATSGNSYHYIQWATEVSEVIGATVEECWNGNGTVKVVIRTADGSADADTISTTKEYIDTKRPVGANVTVVSVDIISINISATITLSTSDISTVTNEFIALVKSHFNDMAMSQDYISIAQIGQMLMSVTGVYDYKDLLLNGVNDNVSLNANQIAELGAVEFNA